MRVGSSSSSSVCFYPQQVKISIRSIDVFLASKRSFLIWVNLSILPFGLDYFSFKLIYLCPIIDDISFWRFSTSLIRCEFSNYSFEYLFVLSLTSFFIFISLWRILLYFLWWTFLNPMWVDPAQLISSRARHSNGHFLVEVTCWNPINVNNENYNNLIMLLLKTNILVLYFIYLLFLLAAEISSPVGNFL